MKEIKRVLYQGEDISSFDKQPEFRRATRNQKLAYFVSKQCLTDQKLDNCALIVATQHGELETTTQYLTQLELTQTPSPLLFQNSLHNSTLGFLSRLFAIRGPGFTVSDGLHSKSEARELAALLLQSTVEYCLVVSVDTSSPKVKEIYDIDGEEIEAILFQRS